MSDPIVITGADKIEMPTMIELQKAVQELLKTNRIRAVNVNVSDDGTWASRNASGTWTDDGEVFLDD